MSDRYQSLLRSAALFFAGCSTLCLYLSETLASDEARESNQDEKRTRNGHSAQDTGGDPSLSIYYLGLVCISSLVPAIAVISVSQSTEFVLGMLGSVIFQGQYGVSLTVGNVLSALFINLGFVLGFGFAYWGAAVYSDDEKYQAAVSYSGGVVGVLVTYYPIVIAVRMHTCSKSFWSSLSDSCVTSLEFFSIIDYMLPSVFQAMLFLGVGIVTPPLIRWLYSQARQYSLRDIA